MALGQLISEYGPILERVSVAVLLVALILSYIIVTRFDEENTSQINPLQKRFLLGVPWGTIIVVVSVYAVYHLIQGAGEPGGPNIVGFRSWSLWYPQSILFSAFSHASDSHMTGNLLATVAFASIVEYAWGHYPTGRGQQSFSSWRTNPFARIGLFVVVTFFVGLANSLLVPGAIIGFSGVVFAFAGFALVARPLLSVGAIVGLQALDLVYSSLRSPLGFAEGDTRFVTPSWADTALQGHLFGMVVGVLLAVVLFRYRKVSPKLMYIWFAALVFAVTRSMWAIYWYLGEAEFVLFRGVGAAAVLILASVVALSVISKELRLPLPKKRVNVPLQTVAISVLVFIVVAVSLFGVPYNLVPVTPGEETQDGIEIDGYTVTYAEGVEDRYTAIDLPVLRDALSVQMSGVVVTSDERNVWAMDTPRSELAFDGRAVVVVGDATWREVVIINRTQWEVAGGETTYKVFGQHWQVDDEQRLLFESDPATAEPTINGTQVSIQPAEEFYDIVVEDANETLGRERVPAHNETVEIAGIEFERTHDELTAVHERTELPLAEYRSGREE